METEVEAPSVSVEEVTVAETEPSPRDGIDAILREFGNIACVGCNRNCDSCPLKNGNPDDSESTSDKSPDGEDNVLVNGAEVESTPEIPPSPSYRELLSDDAVPIVVARPRRQMETKLVHETDDSAKLEKSDASEPVAVAEVKSVDVVPAIIESMGKVVDKTPLVKEVDDELRSIEPEAAGAFDYIDSAPAIERKPIIAKSDNRVVETRLKSNREVFIKVKHVAKPRLVVEVSEKEIVAAKESDLSEESKAVLKTLDKSEIPQLVIEDDETVSEEVAVVREDLIGAEDAYGETTGDLAELETKAHEITDGVMEAEIEINNIDAFSDDIDDDEEIVVIEDDEALSDGGDIDEADDLSLMIEKKDVEELDKPKKAWTRRHCEKIVEVEEKDQDQDEDDVVARQDLTQSFQGTQSYRDDYSLAYSLGFVAVRARIA